MCTEKRQLKLKLTGTDWQELGLDDEGVLMSEDLFLPCSKISDLDEELQKIMWKIVEAYFLGLLKEWTPCDGCHWCCNGYQLAKERHDQYDIPPKSFYDYWIRFLEEDPENLGWDLEIVEIKMKTLEKSVIPGLCIVEEDEDQSLCLSDLLSKMGQAEGKART